MKFPAATKDICSPTILKRFEEPTTTEAVPPIKLAELGTVEVIL